MKIQYCSDLHLEFSLNDKYITENPLKVKGDVLILAGDIVPLHDEFLTHSFFSFISDHYKQVFWIPGNHEYYYKNLTEFPNPLNLKLRSNIRIVNNTELEFEGIRFVFSTLWSEISAHNQKRIEQSISDFECIQNRKRKFNTQDFNTLHAGSLDFIKQSLQNFHSGTVVVSHHVPSPLCNSSFHNNSPINEAFCSNLTDFIENCDANFWIYGHSHFNQKPIYIGKTILLTNQLGYVHLNEQRGYKQNAYFSV
jgi:Icc-related predicted phosphoesterase